MCDNIATKKMALKSKLIVYYLLDDIYLFLQKNGMNDDIVATKMSSDPARVEKRRKAIQQFDNLQTEKDVKQALKFVLQNESGERFERLKSSYKNAKLEVIDYDTKIDIRKTYARIPKYVQRISLWYAYFKLEEE